MRPIVSTDPSAPTQMAAYEFYDRRDSWPDEPWLVLTGPLYPQVQAREYGLLMADEWGLDPEDVEMEGG